MELQRDTCSSAAKGIMSYTEFLQSKLTGHPMQSSQSSERRLYPSYEDKFDDSLVSKLNSELAKASDLINRLKYKEQYHDIKDLTIKTDNSSLYDLKNENARQKRVIEQMNSNNAIFDQKQQKEIKESELIINEKSKNIEELMETLKKEIEMNKDLQINCEKYDVMVQTMLSEKEKVTQKKTPNQLSLSQMNIKDSELINENNKLKQELLKKNQLIKEVIDEMKKKEKIFSEITQMKEEVVTYANKLGEMSKEISKRDAIIEKLRSNQSKDNNASMDYKAKYEFEVKRNETMVKSFQELNRSMAALEQSEATLTKKYEALAKDFNGEHVNKDMIKENAELKQMTKVLISKMEGLPELEKKFKELFDEIIQLKMENELLKKEKGNIKSSNENIKQDDNDNDNEEEEEETKIGNKEEHLEQPIMEDLNLYSLYQSSFLCFNLSQKKFTLTNPKGMKSLVELYQKHGSLFYNTLQGLFILTGKEFKELFYFSQKSDSINKILTFADNHQNGALILNEESKQIVVISGIHTNSVEKLVIEKAQISYLPSMSQKRINSSCCFINRVLYVFFGLSPDQQKCISTIEYLDITSTAKESKWKTVNVDSKEKYELMSHSVICLTEKQILIFGGVDGNKKANTNIIFYDTEANLFEKIALPSNQKESNNPSLFTINPLFKDYCHGNTLAFANVDDSLNIHLFNSSLEHEVIEFKPAEIHS